MNYDVIIIGAGHNGLVCAATLAKAGRRVLVLDANTEPGGAAVNGEIAPGVRAPACAHLLYHLPRRLARELELERHGLRFVARNLPTVALAADGQHLKIQGDTLTGLNGAPVSAADRAAWPRLRARLKRLAAGIAPVWLDAPPRLADLGAADALRLARFGLNIRRLGRADMRELLRIVLLNVADLLEDELEHPLLQGALATEAVLGSFLGPRSPNTVLTLLYRWAHGIGGEQGVHALPAGGIGAYSAALASAARAAGAELRSDTTVREILVENDQVRAVVTASGERLAADIVVSNASARHTLLDLLGARHLDTGFAQRMRVFRCRGATAKLNLVLNAAPAFTGLDPQDLGCRLLIAPSVDYIENAFNPAKYGEYSSAPMFEITVPTAHEPGLAPAGQHILSAIVQYAPYDLKAGWEPSRDAYLDTVLDTLERYVPGIRTQLVATELLAPPDLEQRFGLPGGHWHHGELSMDQMLMLRPAAAAAHYAMPVAGLYLCGASAHPGGDLLGAAGRNAARRVLADGKRR